MDTFKRNLMVLFTVLSGASYQLKAQSGYIVTLQNDTINGTIKGHGGSSVKFVVEGSEEKKKYLATELKSFCIKKSKKELHYQSITLPDDSVNFFAERLEKGKITLYETSVIGVGVGAGIGMVPGASLNRTKNWYAGKENLPIVKIKSNQVMFNKKGREALYAYLEDNSELAEAFKAEGDFSLGNIQSVIKAYNEEAETKK